MIREQTCAESKQAIQEDRRESVEQNALKKCAATSETTAEGTWSAENGLPPAHILIVDDDTSFGKMLERVIRELTGFDCSFVESAREALEVLDKSAVDVVVTDIKMPNMDGIELTRIIKGKYDADIIVITGYHEDITYEEAIENGANDFVEKPVRPTELIIRLKRVLRERAALKKRRQAEDALMKSETRYREIFDRAMEGIFQANPEGRFTAANKALSRMLGYESPDEFTATVTHIPTQLCAGGEDCKALFKLLNEFGSVNCHEVQFRRKDGGPVWISANIMAVRNDDGQILYYEGNVKDISSQKSMEKEREDSLERLRKALGSTVRALAATAEIRDPYTAGHQRRVTDLARAIATKMGLEANRIDGIRMASSIHDLGKVSVPVEILSMPRKLTDMEFSLIKTHSQTGHDILIDIEFPWPVARMVIEHHERIDGSGYPHGLKGDKILLESRIIAVADVVEAIASHRPYRPGFGIDVALDEIVKNNGILYDSEAANACLQLFKEGGYKLVS